MPARARRRSARLSRTLDEGAPTKPRRLRHPVTRSVMLALCVPCASAWPLPPPGPQPIPTWSRGRHRRPRRGGPGWHRRPCRPGSSADWSSGLLAWLKWARSPDPGSGGRPWRRDRGRPERAGLVDVVRVEASGVRAERTPPEERVLRPATPRAKQLIRERPPRLSSSTPPEADGLGHPASSVGRKGQALAVANVRERQPSRSACPKDRAGGVAPGWLTRAGR